MGNSYALIADAIESTSDVFTSIIVLTGLKIASKPADETHPYGHGKAEPFAGIVVAAALFISGNCYNRTKLARNNYPTPCPSTVYLNCFSSCCNC